MGRPIPGQGTQTSSADLGWGQILGLRLEVRRDCKTNPLACTVVLGGGESQCLLKLGSRKGGGEVILILPGGDYPWGVWETSVGPPSGPSVSVG